MYNHSWSSGQKLAFRFFFIFLSLQVLTENFMGNLFGLTLFIWRLGEKIFVGPCLWLNEHIFHFKYIPQTWTTFSGSLHTIRDIVYLLLSVIGCLLWTVLDRKRASYNKLHYWFSQCLVVALSCIVFAYGIVKVFPVQMASPSITSLQTRLGDLSPFRLLWATYGYGKPYQVFCGFFEAMGAVLILSRRTRVVGLLIIVSVMINVVFLNYTYQIGVLVTSFYILLIALFLLAPHAKQIAAFFLGGTSAAPYRNFDIARPEYPVKWAKWPAILMIGTSFFCNIRAGYTLYTRAESLKRTRQYSLVKNYVVNNDTLKLIENDTLCWRTWSERVTDGKMYVTIAPMKPGVLMNYMAEKDSLKHEITLHALGGNNNIPLHFVYTYLDKTNWVLEGTIGQNKIKADLQRINPDTTLELLKKKRTIIIFDDESDSE